MATFDVIVVGLGAMGSSAAYHLARRDVQVLGLEAFDIPHDQGSYHGVNRIFRLAYYEHPSYVPLMSRALELWRALEESAGERLVFVTGSVDAGPPGSEVFEGSVESCRLHDLPHEVLGSSDLSRRFPGFHLPADHRAVFQPDGGFLASERCVVTHIMEAQRLGATVHARERVRDWSLLPGGGVRVVTDRATYEAGTVVFTAGSWLGKLVGELEPLAVAERQVLGWFQPRDPAVFSPDRFPVFNLEVEEGRYYGFGIFRVPGFKLGRYHHLGETTDPDRVDRTVRSADEEVLRTCLRRYFPAADGPTLSLKTCLFTNTPDEHFIIDRLSDEVLVAGGFSGHGFKFASVVGEILADLATEGDTRHDVGLFRLARFRSGLETSSTEEHQGGTRVESEAGDDVGGVVQNP